MDVLGFGPTLLMAYSRPQDESMLFYALFAVRNALALLALQNLSLATTLFPIATGIACLGVVILVAVRRKRLGVSFRKN